MTFLVLTDAFAAFLSSQFAMSMRTRLPWFVSARDVATLIQPIVAGIVLLWLAMIYSAGGYRQRLVGAGSAEYHAVARGSLFTAALLGITAYLFQYPLSRGFYFLLFLIGIPLHLLGRFSLRRLLHRARENGHLRIPLIVAGDTARIDSFANVITRERWVGYDVVGALTYEDPDLLATGVPVLGTPDNALDVVKSSRVSAVVFVEGSFRRPHHFNQLARELEKEEAQLIVIPALTEIASNRVDLQTVAGVPLLTVAKPQAERAGRGLKRSFDIVASVAAICLLSPLMIWAALAVKLGDGGPILFRQPRVGRAGEPFNCLKFRSMVVNADEIKKQMLAANEGAGPLFKMKDDPRVTRVGRFIRRYSIDELPQLFNVLRGEMSLVGPRPALQSEVDQYKSHVMRRLDVRPGITGLWQVSGRSNLSWDDTVRLDLYYVDNWSFMQDINILFRTVTAVFSSDGAY